jgi:hypothetical protein
MFAGGVAVCRGSRYSMFELQQHQIGEARDD